MDEGERDIELFVLDDRGLRDLANFSEGPIRQFEATVTNRQPTVGIIDEGHPLADRRQILGVKLSSRIHRDQPVDRFPRN
jgi:hypothetical protein